MSVDADTFVAEAARALRTASRDGQRATGLIYARAWRLRQRPISDALFGPEPRCTHCGGLIDER